MEHMELAGQMGGSRWFLACGRAPQVHLPAPCQKRNNDIHTKCFSLFLNKVHLVMILGLYLYFYAF